MGAIGNAILGAAEGFLMTGNPIGAGIMGLEGGLTDSNPMTSLMGDNVASGGSDASGLMALADIAEVAG